MAAGKDRNQRALENSTGRGEWFGKHRALVRNFVGHRQQIHYWKLQILGVRAIAPDDAEHGAFLTMTRIAGATKIATAATGVDLTNDTLARRQRPEHRGGLTFNRSTC